MDQSDTTRCLPTDAALAADGITVYYDRSCPLCRHEIETLHAAPARTALTLVDCSAPGFSDPLVAAANVSQCELMSAIHIHDPALGLLTGPRAFAHLYANAGLDGLARLWGTERLAWLVGPGYRWVARHRRWLSSSGIGPLYVRFLNWRLARAAQRATAQAAT